jgi:hypothetical protein
MAPTEPETGDNRDSARSHKASMNRALRSTLLVALSALAFAAPAHAAGGD